MGISSAGEAAALAALLTGRYISLHTGDPGDDGADEVSGNGYARVSGGTFTASGGNPTTASNDGVIEFDAATGSWGTVSYFGVWSAASGGTFLGGSSVAVPKAYGAEDIARFDAEALEFEAD